MAEIVSGSYLIEATPLMSESPQADFKPHEDSECFLCERGMAESSAGCWVEMTTMGKLVRHDIPAEERAKIESQGCFPVGPRCTKKVPKAFRLAPPDGIQKGTVATISARPGTGKSSPL